jgi:hypothetical protein
MDSKASESDRRVSGLEDKAIKIFKMNNRE